MPGPFSLASHADDLLTVADHLGCETVPIVGHSMGAFVTAVAAERHPDRVERLVLIDGGLPFPLDVPADADVEAVVQSVIGPALDRLDQRWPDVEAYVEFFRAHPAFQPPNEWPPTAEAYVRYDAVTEADGQVRSSVSKEAVLVDGGAAIVDPESSAALTRVTTPTDVLWAPRGILDATPGLYIREAIERWVGELANVEASLVDDTNHYTILVGERALPRCARPSYWPLAEQPPLAGRPALVPRSALRVTLRWRLEPGRLTMTYKAVWPRSPQAVEPQELAPRPASLDGLTVAFLWDHLFRGDEIYPVIADELRQRYADVTVVDHTAFGSTHGEREAELVAALPDRLREVGVDAVVSGMAC